MAHSTCSVDGCERRHKSRGLCNVHYMEAYRLAELPPRTQPVQGCSIEDCDRKHVARGLCNRHYMRWRANATAVPTATRRIFSIPAVDGMKECTSCQRVLPVDAFYRSRYSDGYRAECKKCQADRHLMRTYGLTRAEHDARAEAQGGACAICGIVPEGMLVTDHCHDSNNVRELLCDACNSALGFLGDDPDRALSAVAYLRKWAHLKEAPRGA